MPLFLMLLIGMAARKGGLIREEETHRLNHMLFMICYPALMFDNLYGSEIGEVFDGKLIAFALVSVLGTYFISIPVIMKIEPGNKSRGAMIQAIYRSNAVIMGLPIVMNVYGSGNLAVTALVIAIIVPLYNVLAVVTLEVFRGGKVSPGHILLNVVKNPLIIGAAVGLLFVFTGWKLPASFENVISQLSGCAMVMAMIVLGASFTVQSLVHGKRDLIICVTSRLVIVPAVWLTAAAFLGFRGVAFVTLLAMLASPTAIASYTMAESMDSDGPLAGNCVIFSSAFSCLTLFIWLFIFKNLGLF